MPDVGSQTTKVALDALEAGLTSAIGANIVPGVDRGLFRELDEAARARAEARADSDSVVVLDDLGGLTLG